MGEVIRKAWLLEYMSVSVPCRGVDWSGSVAFLLRLLGQLEQVLRPKMIVKVKCETEVWICLEI